MERYGGDMGSGSEQAFEAATQGDHAMQATRLTAQQVADYLKRHPDFFVERADLLLNMTPPSRWKTDAVVDLQRHWVEVLKCEIAGLRDCASSVIETSRVNLATQTRIHAAVLALLNAATMDELLRVVSDELPNLLEVDLARIGLEAAEHAMLPDDVALLPDGGVEQWLGGDDVALLPAISDDGTLFGAAAEEIRSAALVRLSLPESMPAGLIAFGSSNSGAFTPRQGSELLRFLTHVVAWCLGRQPLAWA